MITLVPKLDGVRAVRSYTYLQSRLTVALLGATLGLAVACNDSMAPLPREGRPVELQFSMGGFGGTSAVLSLQGDTVVARRWPWDRRPGETIDSIRVVPSTDAWRAFWTAAAAAGVDRWSGKYAAEGFADGLGWGLRVVANGRVIESYGSNAYPDRDGRKRDLEMPPEFRALITAVNGLVGRTDWFR
jgi:hypothetical protein